MSLSLKTALLTTTLAIGIVQPRVSFAQDVKIATVDTNTLIRATDEGKLAEDKVQKRFQTLSTEMERTRKDIESKETRLREQDRLMSAAAKTQLSREIEDDKLRFDRKNEDYQKEISEMENTLLAPLTEKVQVAVAAYVNEKGYQILIDLSTQNGNVVWANPRNDITQEVMKRMNEAYKAAAATAATPAPKAEGTIPPVPAPPKE